MFQRFSRPGASLAGLLALLAPARGVLAQATLVKDIRPGGSFHATRPLGIVAAPGRVYFQGSLPGGRETIWTSDGTVAGTQPVTEQVEVSVFTDLAVVGSTLYFAGAAGGGIELWKSDGPAAGATRVKDINPGDASSHPRHLTDVRGTLFFSAYHSDYGEELWKSDGSEAGTVQLKDIRPGTGGSDPSALTDVNGTLFFAADDGSPGAELWKSDGTAGGTVKVADIHPGAFGVFLTELTNVNGRLFFLVEDASQDRELWTSDGAGVRMLRSWPSGSVYGLVDFNGVLFFWRDGELWRSDGTVAGTYLVVDLAPAFRARQGVVSGPTLYFSVDHAPEGEELWKTDGTAAGTVLVKDISAGGLGSYPQALTSVNGVLFFTAEDGLSVSGRELWKSDGTEGGTVRVLDLRPGPESSGIYGITASAGLAFFSGSDGSTGNELWRSDGTPAGTRRLSASSAPFSSLIYEPPVALGQTLLFAAEDGTTQRHLWKTDGTEPGTAIVRDINPAGSSHATFLTVMGGRAYFGATDGTDYGLWSTDGTFAGTRLVSNASAPAFAGMIAVGSTLFFDGQPAPGGDDELWKSDGTAAGTVLVKDIAPGSASSYPERLTDVNGTLFFTAATPETGRELWRSDGTESGTVLVKDIAALPAVSSSPQDLTPVGNLLYFTADDQVHGRELWRSDGTAAGTVLVKDIYPGLPPGIPPAYEYFPDDHRLIARSGTLFLLAGDASTGTELWKSDGTEAGTVLVRDLAPGSETSFPGYLTEAGGLVFFRALDPATGLELWRSDGTAAGTFLVKDIRPGPSWSAPWPLANLGGTLFFGAIHPIAGQELWRSDGSAAGTVMVADVNPGAAGSVPFNLSRAGQRAFFVAHDRTVGQELWTTPLGPAFSVADVTVNEGTPGPPVSAVVTVTLSPPTALASVEVATLDGSATSPADYTAFSGSLAFAPGQTSQTVTIPIAPDDLDEGDETFSVVLSAPTGAVLGRAQAQVTIRDNDGPSISIADVTVAEGSVGPTVASLTVSLSAPSVQPVSVSYGTANGTASAPADYVASSGRLDFLPGTTSLTVTIPVVADTMDELDEWFLVELSGPQNATLARLEARATVQDDDEPPTISIGDVVLLEGNEGLPVAILRLSLSAPSGKVVRVVYTTRDGTATAGSDYSAITSLHFIPPGTATNTLTVTVHGDQDIEPDETFFVDLSSPVDATLGDAEGQGTILDDDQPRAFHTVTPCRLVDTRNPPGPSGGPALGANTSRTFPVAGRCTVPATARAVAVSMTAVNPGAVGDFRLYPAGGNAPLASVLNFAPGRSRAGNAVIALGNGQISVQCDMPAGSTAATHFVLDVYGYFE